MTEEQLREAVHEYDYGNKIIARQILLDVVANEPDNEEAWLLLSIYSETSEQKISALRCALSINPKNYTTLELLRQSGISDLRVSENKSLAEIFAPVSKSSVLAKKDVDVIASPPDSSPLTIGKVKSQSPERKTPENRRLQLGIGLLGGAILLWGIFFGLMIKGPSPRYIVVTGKNSTDAGPTSTTSPELKPAPSNTAGATDLPGTPTTPAITEPAPSPSLTPVSTFRPGASETPPATVVIDALFTISPSILPSWTAVPSATSTPSVTAMPTFQNPAGTKADPVKAGSGYQFSRLGILKVENSTWLKGQTGPMYIGLSFSCEKPADEICATGVLTLTVVAGTGAVYPRSDNSSTPRPWFGSNNNLPTYGGTIEQSNAGFLIFGPETVLLLRVKNTLDPGSEVYFALP